MLTAKKARKQAINKWEVRGDLKEVAELIRRACKDGAISITYKKQLPGYMLKHLSELGYQIVTCTSNHVFEYHKISW